MKLFLKFTIATLCLFSVQYKSFSATHIITSTDNAGVGSLRATVSQALSGDTIRFSPSLIGAGSDTIMLDSAIFLNKSLTIVGLYNSGDTLFISGNGNNGIFRALDCPYINNSILSINLDSLAFIESSNARAVHLESCLQNVISSSVKNCSFNRNLNGALKVSDFAIIENCRFANNIVNDGIFDDGGAGVYVELGDSNFCEIKNCTFINNSSVGSTRTDGGAVEVRFNNSSQNSFSTYLKVSYSDFYGNKCISDSMSYAKGGAIHASGFTYSSNAIYPTLEIENSSFTGNNVSAKSFAQGGAIHTSDINLFVHNSVLDSNFTISNTGFGSVSGGAIDYTGRPGVPDSIAPILSIVNSSLVNNYCDGRGPSGGALEVMGPAKILNSTVVGNRVVASSSIYSSPGIRTCSSLRIENSTLLNNTIQSPSGISQNNFSACCFNPIFISSSIIVTNSSIPNTNFNCGFISGGNNIFSDTLLSSSISSDILGVQESNLKLNPLALNSKQTITAIPSFSSPAINAGNIFDASDAQNGPIVGRRDIGAAENCAVIADDHRYACDSLVWIDGNTYFQNNDTALVVYTNGAVNGCDSVVRLFLEMNIDTTLSLNGNILSSNESYGYYQWFNVGVGNPVIIGATSRTYQATSNGTYAVEISQGTCVRQSQPMTISTIGFEDLGLGQLMLYPNPSSGHFKIKLEKNAEIDELKIFDLTGSEYNVSYKKNGLELDVELRAEPGIYFVKIESERGNAVAKILIE